MIIDLAVTELTVEPELNAVNLTITPTFTSGGGGGSGAEQTQSDWNQTDELKKDFIKNKPDIPTKTSELENDSGFITLDDVPQSEKDVVFTLLKVDAVFDETWLKIARDYQKDIKNCALYARTSQGIIELNPIVKYPAAETYIATDIFNGFLLGDSDNFIWSHDWEELYISYNRGGTINNYDVKTNVLGHNVVLEEYTGYYAHAHSSAGAMTYAALYPDSPNTFIQAILDPLTNYCNPPQANDGNQSSYEGIRQEYLPTYMRLKGANILSRPYVNAAKYEDFGSNPEILCIGSHYLNTFARHDLTADENTFLKNAIAIGARTNDTTTMAGTSYGFGMEFFEDFTNIMLQFPNAKTFKPVIQLYTDATGTITNSVEHAGMTKTSVLEVGETVEIRYSDHTEITVIQEVIDGQSIRVLPAITPIGISTTNVYLWHLGTLNEIWGDGQYQSPVCTIIAYKFRKIQDATGASWQICREAARATASNNGVWDMYRGFGSINADAAVEYIKTKYTENADLIAEKADRIEGENLKYKDLSYADILPNTPLPKKIVEATFQPIMVDNQSYVTDDEKEVLSLTSGENTGDETLASISALIGDSDTKPTPIAADSVGLWDSVALKFVRTSLTNLVVFLGGYFAKKTITAETQTLVVANWTLVSGFYEYNLANANITATKFVEVIPNNATIEITKAAELLPTNVSSAGSVKIYAKNMPTANIVVTINIYE